MDFQVREDTKVAINDAAQFAADNGINVTTGLGVVRAALELKHSFLARLVKDKLTSGTFADFKRALNEAVLERKGSKKLDIDKVQPSPRLLTSMKIAGFEMAQRDHVNVLTLAHLLMGLMQHDSDVIRFFAQNLLLVWSDDVRRMLKSYEAQADKESGLETPKRGFSVVVRTPNLYGDMKAGKIETAYGAKDPQKETKKVNEPQKDKGSSELADDSPLLRFGRDLTAEARDGKIPDPVVGRDEIIARVIKILSLRKKNNPALIGDPGIGKTAIAEGLAQRIVEGRVPEWMKDKILVSLDMGAMIAGTRYRGDFEERLKAFIDAVIADKRVLMFIDEMHTLIGAGATSGGAMDASNLLKPALSRGQLRCVGATTYAEYRKYVEKDAALARRFQPVVVEEPSRADAIYILEGLRPSLEEHHHLRIEDEALPVAVDLAIRHLKPRGRFLPDAPIDILDLAAGCVRFDADSLPPEALALLEELSKTERDLRLARLRREDEKAAALELKLKELRERVKAFTEQRQPKEGDPARKALVVTAESVRKAASILAGHDLTRLEEDEKKALRELEKTLTTGRVAPGEPNKGVIGQEEAKHALAVLIRRAKALQNTDRDSPIASMIASGPSGVGKTLTAQILADTLGIPLIRFDMSEYMEKHSVARLIGAPPGYVGFEEAGRLTEAVRQHPHCVLLLDEIEKAHPDIFNILLQVMHGGRLTDGQGRTVDFTNVILIMTTNLGSQHQQQKTSLGERLPASEKQTEEETFEAMRERIMNELTRFFRIEFLNRVDEVITYRVLTKEEIYEVVDQMVAKELWKYTVNWKVKVDLDPAAINFLNRSNKRNAAFNARPVEKKIKKHVTDMLVDAWFADGFTEGDTLKVLPAAGGKSLTFIKVNA